MQHGRKSQTVSLLRDQVRRLQEQLDFLKDSKEFNDLDSSRSSGRSHVPHQPLTTLSSRRKLIHEFEVPRNTREYMRNSGNVFGCTPVRQGLEGLCDDSRNLATSSRMHKDRTEKGVSGKTATTMPMLHIPGRARDKRRDSGDCSLFTTYNHAASIGTCTHSGMTNNPGHYYQAPKFILENCLTTRNFKAGE